jgi:hypothetical protein
MNYYRIFSDLSIKNGWFLNTPITIPEISFWKFTKTERLLPIPTEIIIPIAHKGIQLDITMAAFEIIIVNSKAILLFDDEEVQKIPVTISDAKDDFFIIIPLYSIDAIDRKNSAYKIWEVGNKIRPDKAGQFKDMETLIIDSSLVNSNVSIFRAKDYNIAIIVNEVFKNKFEELMLKGIKFIPCFPQLAMNVLQ